MKLLFVQQKCKHCEMAFLTSRSVSKHVLFALGVDPTARDAGEGGGSDLVSQATPVAVSCETSSRRCSLATLPIVTRRQTNTLTTFLGCPSCISVTKKCYQIGFLESSVRSFFFS